MQNIEIEVEGQPLALYPGTTLNFEWNNPIFADEVVPGSFSLPFDVPAAPNATIFGFPEVIANTANKRKEYACTIRSEGEEIRGILKLRKVTNLRYTLNVQIGNSAFGDLLKNKSLRDFEYGGERVMGDNTVGVLDHMWHTVKHPDQYDYIFAQLHNPDFYGEKNTSFGGMVNQFMIKDSHTNKPYAPVRAGGSTWYDLDGEPVYSHFAFNDRSRDYNTAPWKKYNICPFPKLRYILLQLTAEIGATVDEDFFDSELTKLYVLSNAALDKLVLYAGDYYLNAYATSFRIADLLPDMPVVKFFEALKDTFGLTVQVDLDKKITIKRLSLLLESSDYLDLTPYVAPGHENEVTDMVPLKLTYKLDDGRASDRVKDFEEEKVKVLDPVQFIGDLPLPAEHKDVRYVTSRQQYYIYQLQEEPVGWKFYADNYLPLNIGTGGTKIEQGIALTQDYAWRIFSNLYYRMPAFAMQGYSPAFGVYNVPTTLRLAFYRGLQPNYPLLSGDNYNAHGLQVGDYSLKLDGEHGTYNKFLKGWLEIKVNPNPIIRQLFLSMALLKSIDFNRKVDIDGNRFLFRKLKFSLPLKKPVTAELVQLKK